MIAATVGVFLRLVRYLTDRPLWGDEAMVAVNVLGRGYAELLGPLAFYQVAPAGFLWIERGMLDLFGASEWTLRLAPVAAGIAAVPLFAWVARRAVGGPGALLAVSVFAVSYAPIRHSTEVKPYAFDLLAALMLLGPAVCWLRRPGRSGPLWALSAIAPVALACSLPSAFVAGGIGLALTPVLWGVGRKAPERKLWKAWVVYLGVVPLAFLGLFLVSTGSQSEAVGEVYRRGYWSGQFPPLGDPIRLVGWLVSTHLGAGFGYPIGGERGASLVSSALIVVGIVALSRKGDRPLLALLLAPIGLTLLASAIGRYPYGGTARTMQHVAPSACLLVGVGAQTLIGRRSDPARRDRAMALVLAILGLIGAGMLVIDLARPFRTVEDQRTRDFARWFWPEVSRGAEVGCVHALRGTTFEGTYWRRGRLELYLANRQINLPHGVDPARPRVDRVSRDRPLRCVIYNQDPDRDPGLAAWLDEMGTRYRLRRTRSYEVNGGIVDRGIPREERFLVYEYVPKGGVTPGPIADAGDAR